MSGVNWLLARERGHWDDCDETPWSDLDESIYQDFCNMRDYGTCDPQRIREKEAEERQRESEMR